MDIFELFENRPVTLIVLNQTSQGLGEGKRYETTAVWKWRRGFEKSSAQQQALGDATVYIRPTEPFMVAVGDEAIGNLVELDGVLYRIFAQSEGRDFDTGTTSHYRLAVEKHERTEEWQDDFILT